MKGRNLNLSWERWRFDGALSQAEQLRWTWVVEVPQSIEESESRAWSVLKKIVELCVAYLEPIVRIITIFTVVVFVLSTILPGIFGFI